MNKKFRNIADRFVEMQKNFFRWIKHTLKNPRFWKGLVTWSLRVFAVLLVVIAITFIVVSRDLPQPDQFSDRDVQQSTKIYARDGSLLYEVHGEVKRTVIPFSQMNSNIQDAVVSIEDKNFYREGGISYSGILRAFIVDIFHLGASQGGSTITQEYVRNAVLTQNKTFGRKIKEIILSIEVASHFSKNQVMEYYLNEIPFGRNAYGIQAAAQAYYGIDAQSMDLAQSAYIAALIQAPSHYDPLGPYREELDDRKNDVLDLMLQQKYITQQQHDQAKAEVVKFQPNTNTIVAPHFVFYIENYLEQKYGDDAVENGGLQVYTTLDPSLQKDAEQAIDDYAATNEKKYNADNEALVAVDPKTGQILAMVGSKDYFGTPEPAGCTPGVNCTFEPNTNVATSLRQPGSSVKPYVYGTAFEQPYDEAPATVREDVITDFGSYGGVDYIPHDYDPIQRGPETIRMALDGSLNIPAVKTLDIIGVDAATKTMHDFGITAPLQNCGLSLVLGGCEVTLLDHTSGYATFATEGVHHQETGILKVLDDQGNTLEQYQDQTSQVMDPQAAYEIDNVLSDNSSRAYVFGANSPMKISGRTVAAKTGTTQNFRDGWTLGFTPSLAAGVWAGNNDGTLLKNGSDGVVVAAPIWHDFMVKALGSTPNEDFPVPAGITTMTIDPLSGLLPTQYTPTTTTDIFASYAVPTAYDNLHIPASSTGCADTNNCPASGIYTELHSEMPNNPSWENPVVQWGLANGYTYPPGGVSFGGTQGTGTAPGGGGTTPPADAGNPPIAIIESPTDGSSVSGSLTLQAEGVPDQAHGNTITRIDLLVDGTIVQSIDNTSDSLFNINGLSSGSHTLAIHVVDSKGNTADTSITVTVQ
jgi:membrane peptidoglycan carboxypeptidase